MKVAGPASCLTVWDDGNIDSAKSVPAVTVRDTGNSRARPLAGAAETNTRKDPTPTPNAGDVVIVRFTCVPTVTTLDGEKAAVDPGGKSLRLKVREVALLISELGTVKIL